MLSDMETTVLTRAAFVLAGGRSSRMGAGIDGAKIDKAFLEFRGQTLLNRALETVRALCEKVAIVGDPAKFASHAALKDEVVVGDIFPGCGPLGGIHAALLQSSADLNLMLAVDMPFVAQAFLDFLFTTAERNTASVTVPKIGKGWQPLCAIYRRDFAQSAEEALRAGKYKIDALFCDISVNAIEAPELIAAGFSENNFFNVNTPEDHLIVKQNLR
jgi:molybdopterin-guanine dinucleotide biosynthesis protein A